jgi:hypothetical protein
VGTVKKQTASSLDNVSEQWLIFEDDSKTVCKLPLIQELQGQQLGEKLG